MMDDIWEQQALWFAKTLAGEPIPPAEIIKNIAMFQDPDSVRRFLFFDHIYRTHIIGRPGSIMEFGVRWGRDLVWLAALHFLYEPDAPRGIAGFDTFDGHIGWSEIDGENEHVQDGAFPVPEGYAEWLLEFLSATVGPYSNNSSLALSVGDVRSTLPTFLEREPQTAVVCAIFDLDLYDPTRQALVDLVPFLSVGSVLVFDEFASEQYPGESVAVRDVFGGRLRLDRLPYGGSACWGVVTGEVLDYVSREAPEV